MQRFTTLLLIALLTNYAARDCKAQELRTERHAVDGTGIKAEDLAALIHDHVFALEFSESQATLNVDADALVLLQRADVHAKVRDFLALLRKPLAPGEMATSDADAWRTELEAQLSQKRVSVKFNHAPLDTAAAELSKSSGVSIRVDPEIDAARMPKIELKLDDVSLESALKWIARESKTGFCLHDHAIVMTTQPELECRIYNIADIVNPPWTGVRLVDFQRDLEYYRSRSEDVSSNGWGTG
jgi:hypothetical protein